MTTPRSPLLTHCVPSPPPVPDEAEMSDDLVTWLRAQIDNDERLARRVQSSRHAALFAPGSAEDPAPGVLTGDRLLAEVEAKRRILGAIFTYEAKIDSEWGCCHSAEDIAAGLCPETPPHEITAVRLLALPYAANPGFREEWRP